MSAICGLIYKDNNASIREDVIFAMSNSLRVQKDREASTFIEKNVGLGGSDYKQLFAGNRSIKVVCDAELYNLKEIIEFLKKKGYTFKYETESEAIAYLYEEYNYNCVEKMRGIFAFALWDEEKKSLLVATDRFGIKPVTYYEDPEKFIFASKIKAILQCNISKEINNNSLLRYLNYSVVPTPDTIFKDIYKLSPGHILILKDGGIRIQQYWDMEYPEFTHPDGESYYTEKLKEATREAVETCLDGPSEKMGAFLSGGTDSSTVVGMISEITGRKVKTFSIGFTEERYNEMSYARLTSRHFNTEHHEYFVTPEDVLRAVPLLVKEYDEPFGNSSAIPTYYCAKLAKDHGVDVMFAGDGGDELFGGNERYITEKIFSLYQRIPYFLRRRALEPFIFTIPVCIPLIGKARKYISRSNIPNPGRLYSYNYLLSTSLEDIFTRDFMNGISRDSLLETPEHYYNNIKASSELNRLLYLDLKLAITDNDLPKVNRMAEIAGVSVRYPLLDYRLAEFSGTIPSYLKLKGFKIRYIFKEAFKEFLPEEVIKKKKHGFGLPTSVWLKTDKDLHDLARSTLLSSKSIQRGYFKKEAIEFLFDEHQKDTTSYYGDIIWLFMMLELWHKEYIDC